MSSQKVFNLEKKSLRRVLSAGHVFAVGYGDVGSSIYYALGATALYAGGATPLAMLIAGAFFVCTALTYSELSTMFNEPGGSAVFTRYAFNDVISFIAGWGLLLDFIVTTAISAFAVLPYMKHLFLGTFLSDTTVHLTGTCLIIFLLFLLNLWGIRESGRFSFLLAVFTIVTQALVIIIAAFFLLNLPYVISHLRIGVEGAAWSPTWRQFFEGTAMAMVAYTGIESMAQLSAEVKRPGILMPRAIKWVIAIVIFLYFSISSVALSVMDPRLLGTKYIDDPVVGIVYSFPVGGQILGPWIGLIAGLILLIAANAGLIGCSRLTFSMGKFYQLPSVFYRLHHKFKTPYFALAFFSALSMIVVVMSQGYITFLTNLYNFGAQIAFFFAHLSLVMLRIKKPTHPRPYRAPFNIPIGKNRSLPLTALLGMLATFSVWCVVVITKPDGRYLGIAWMAIGLAMYTLYRRKKGLETKAVEIEQVKVPGYAPMHFKNILVGVRYLGGTEALQMACQIAKAHKAKITAVHILEIASSIPLETAMPRREQAAEVALQRAEAVAREYDLSIHLELVRSRSITSALIDIAKRGDHDLIVVGASANEIAARGKYAYHAENLIKEAPCKVLFCKT